MKNLLTSMACLMLLLAFVLQFTQNQLLFSRITAVDQAVNNFKEIVKQEGGVTEENEKELKKTLGEILECREEQIKVDGSRQRVFRGQLIRYQVEVPISGIIAVPLFWGIGEEENRLSYRISRCTTSEYIGRL